ncbi:fimbria/pilus outer membrane usher protein [Aeromonas veronii]|uniref:fimbria/pilus outer membrane usher protein n=1 Tax=Aeromonas veronii TaxID=654 RepID=UPI003D1C64A3
MLRVNNLLFATLFLHSISVYAEISDSRVQLALSSKEGKAQEGVLDITASNQSATDVYAQQYGSSYLANGVRLSQSAYANQINATTEKVTIEIPAVAEGIFYGSLSRNSFTLSEKGSFIEFLKVNNIRNSKLIADRFSTGIESDPTCVGFRSECVVLTKDFSIVIDYYQKKIRLFINSDLFGAPPPDEEYRSIQGENILANKAFAFYNKTESGNSYLLKNEGYSGLGSGFFYYNFDLQNQQSKLNDINYSWLHQNKKLQIGRTGYGQYFNYAQSKSFLANDGFQGITIGTTEELNLTKSDKKFPFFTPAPAIITLTRGGREVYKRYVPAGANSISYQDLPKGAYQADVLIVDDNGGTIHESTTFIFNDTSSFGDDVEAYAQYGYTTNGLDKTYGAGISIPIIENLVVYSSFNYLNTENIFSLGAEFRSDIFGLSAVVSKSDNIKKSEAMFNLFGLTGNYNEETVHKNNLNNLSNSDEYNRTIGLSYNQVIAETNILSYSYTNYLSSTEKTDAYGIRYSAPIYANIFISAGYERRGDDNIINFSASIPLGKHMSNTVTSNYQDKWDARLTSTYNDYYNDDTSYNLGVSVGQGGDKSLNGNLNYNGTAASTSARVNLSNTGNSYGAQVDSTQLISSSGIDFINSRRGENSSFIIVDKELIDNITLNYKSTASTIPSFIEKDSNVIPINSFDRYTVTGQMRTGDYVFENGLDKFRDVSDIAPGKAIRITSSTKKVIQNFLYTEHQGQDLKCSGDGCISFERITDNLYRLRSFLDGGVVIETPLGECSTLNKEFRSKNSDNLAAVRCEKL